MDIECENAALMSDIEDQELLCRAASGHVEAKLQLVKKYLDLVIELAASHTLGTERQFPKMVRVGVSALIEAANSFQNSYQIGFANHVRYEVDKAMARDVLKEVDEVKAESGDIWEILGKSESE
jgi:DNA-directed RNA polymerase specialized sigma subunit